MPPEGHRPYNFPFYRTTHSSPLTMGDSGHDGGIQHPHHPTLSPEANNLDVEHYRTIQKFLQDMNFGEDNVDLTEIHFRPVFKPWTTRSATLLFYFALVAFGIIANLIVLGIILRRKLHKLDNRYQKKKKKSRKKNRV